MMDGRRDMKVWGTLAPPSYESTRGAEKVGKSGEVTRIDTERRQVPRVLGAQAPAVM